jgi:predicted ATP-grasp superfamily ATP-dependent carboligase
MVYLNVIITSAPFNVVSLAVGRSLGKKNIDFTVYSKKEKTLIQYSKYCRNSIISSNNIDLFSKLTPENIVYPIDEKLMLQLSKNKKNLPCLLAFSEYQTLVKVINKSRLMQHAIENNIPCPKTIFIDRIEDINKIKDFSSILEFPMVLKPSTGSGGKGVITINSLKEFHSVGNGYFDKYGPFILQEKIPFVHKYTVGVLCNADSEVRRACVIKEIRNYPIDTGPACYAETVDYPELLKLSIKLMKSLNYFGIADIDFLVDSRTGKPILMEINPRFWGSLQVAINAGVDFPYLLFEMMKNGDVAKSLEYKTGVRCRHLVFDDIHRLLSIIKGKHSSIYKVNSIIEFLKFHPEDGYYVFCLDDLNPFQHLLSKKILNAIRISEQPIKK